MRTSMTLAVGIFLSGFMVLSVNAGPAAAGNAQKKQPVASKQKAPPPKKPFLSKRNRAKIEVEEQKKLRQQLRTGDTK